VVSLVLVSSRDLATYETVLARLIELGDAATTGASQLAELRSETQENPHPVFYQGHRCRQHRSPAPRQPGRADRADVLALDEAPRRHTALRRVDWDVGRNPPGPGGERQDHDEPRRALIETVHRDDERRPSPTLLMAADRVEVREPELAT